MLFLNGLLVNISELCNWWSIWEKTGFWTKLLFDEKDLCETLCKPLKNPKGHFFIKSVVTQDNKLTGEPTILRNNG